MTNNDRNSEPSSYQSVLDPGVSSYLDFLRIMAALTVLLSHYIPTLFKVDPNFIPGHDAVIIFFVMSGYVIAYVGDTRDRPLERFAIHRLARLWSVLIPALAISGIAAVMVPDQAVNEAAPAISSFGAFVSASLKSLFFLGEGWVGATAAPYNAPIWSLNFEAWYYAIFAAFTFGPRRWRYGLSGALALLAGPRVLALFPCWLLGAWVYRHRAAATLNPLAGYALFSMGLLAYAVAYHFDLTTQSRYWLSHVTAGESYHLGPSTSVIGDTLLAPIVAVTIFVLPSMPAVNRMFVWARCITRIAASRTLSLYLFHMPILAILYGGLGIGNGSAWGAALCLVLGIASALLIGGGTEAQVGMWREGLRWAYRLTTEIRTRVV
jgi:peptidoglycan/LPS O-acetylase OafA/YrhL